MDENNVESFLIWCHRYRKEQNRKMAARLSPSYFLLFATGKNLLQPSGHMTLATDAQHASVVPL